jgi:acetyltransferase
MSSGFGGTLHPVNPKHDFLYGHKSYKSIKDIETSVDMAVISIPSKFVKTSIQECVEKHVKIAVIISAGFSEISNEGSELEKEILEIAKNSEMRILGPNCLGIIDTNKNYNATFAASNAVRGNVGFISQSGALCTLLLDMSLEKNVGFSSFVSIGNKLDLSELDFLEYWAQDPDTQVLSAYLEDVENGDQFYKLVAKIDKPFVLLTPGKTKEAQDAISSHTGSLASPYKVIETALEQSGAIRVDDTEELFNTIMALSWSKPLLGNRLAIVTNAGGPGVLATDAFIENGFEITKLGHVTNQRLKAFLPPEASIANPIDLLGTAISDHYEKAIQAATHDTFTDGVVVIVTPQLITEIEETAKRIIELSKDSEKPIWAIFLGGRYASGGLRRLYDNKVPAFNFINDAARTLKNIYNYSKHKPSKTQIEIQQPKYTKEINDLMGSKEKAIPTKLTEKILGEFSIDIPKQAVVKDTADMNEFVDRVGFPVVLKAESEDIAHKTEFKALYLNIESRDDLYRNFNKLKSDVEKITNKRGVGLLIQEQIKTGEELILGIERDGGHDVYHDNKPGFGHLLLFGKGGIHTEVYKDFAASLVPSSLEDIEEMVSKTRIYQVLKGIRGSKKLALDKLYQTLVALNKMALAYPQISTMDINPLFLTEDRAIAVDVKIFLKE